ncbi:hypothetical protein P9112_005838 [Eukaryota sp. TZLM1-RC]
MFAVLKQRFEAASLLLQYGANPSHRDVNGRSVLHLSAYHNIIPSIEYCLSLGIFVDFVDHFSQTALHLATLAGNVNAALLLLSHNASPSLRDSYGMTPYLYAVEHQCHELLDVLPPDSFSLEGFLEERTQTLSSIPLVKAKYSGKKKGKKSKKGKKGKKVKKK